jgi:hypothetical protein
MKLEKLLDESEARATYLSSYNQLLSVLYQYFPIKPELTFLQRKDENRRIIAKAEDNKIVVYENNALNELKRVEEELPLVKKITQEKYKLNISVSPREAKDIESTTTLAHEWVHLIGDYLGLEYDINQERVAEKFAYLITASLLAANKRADSIFYLDTRSYLDYSTYMIENERIKENSPPRYNLFVQYVEGREAAFKFIDSAIQASMCKEIQTEVLFNKFTLNSIISLLSLELKYNDNFYVSSQFVLANDRRTNRKSLLRSLFT